MYTAQFPHTVPDKLSRCRDSNLFLETGQPRDDESILLDAALAHEVDQALWKDEVLRAIDYYEVDIQVINRIVILNGHITSSTSNNRVEKAISTIPDILGVRNNLVLDDKLTMEVASALGILEHTYQCKFFTGVSHGVVALHGNVSDENVKSLAEKSVASNPDVRGVINCVRVQGSVSELQDMPIYQPAIGKEILFLNGVSGLVRQVIINPDNRRVFAMTLTGRFTDQRQESQSMSNNEPTPPDRLIVVSVELIRYLTKYSGYLTISSNDRSQYADFDPADYRSPDVDWVPPYPYCPQDVLFSLDAELSGQPIASLPLHSLLGIKLKAALDEQIMANDSLGG